MATMIYRLWFFDKGGPIEDEPYTYSLAAPPLIPSVGDEVTLKRGVWTVIRRQFAYDREGGTYGDSVHIIFHCEPSEEVTIHKGDFVAEK